MPGSTYLSRLHGITSTPLVRIGRPSNLLRTTIRICLSKSKMLFDHEDLCPLPSLSWQESMYEASEFRVRNACPSRYGLAGNNLQSRRQTRSISKVHPVYSDESAFDGIRKCVKQVLQCVPLVRESNKDRGLGGIGMVGRAQHGQTWNNHLAAGNLTNRSRMFIFVRSTA